MHRLRGRGDGFDPPVLPQRQQTSSLQQRPLLKAEEQAVAPRPRTSTGATDALQERRHGPRSIDLDHPVQVADVDAELQGRGGHDHAVPGLAEGRLGLPALVDRQRGVGQERRHVVAAQSGGQLLDPGAAVGEHQTLLPPVQAGDDGGGVVKRADVVHRHLGPRSSGFGRRVDDLSRLGDAASLQPRQQAVRVTDRCRQPEALHRPTSQGADALEQRQKVPAAVVASEGVDLVDDDGADAAQERSGIDAGRDHHDLERLGRRQQDVGRFGQHPRSHRPPDVAVPQPSGATHHLRVGLQPGMQVVQQRLERADVQHRQAVPVLGEHPGQDREDRRLGLPACGGCQHDRVLACQHRTDRLLLQRAQRRPPEGVDHVVDHGGVQQRRCFPTVKARWSVSHPTLETADPRPRSPALPAHTARIGRQSPLRRSWQWERRAAHRDSRTA